MDGLQYVALLQDVHVQCSYLVTLKYLQRKTIDQTVKSFVCFYHQSIIIILSSLEADILQPETDHLIHHSLGPHYGQKLRKQLGSHPFIYKLLFPPLISKLLEKGSPIRSMSVV